MSSRRRCRRCTCSPARPFARCRFRCEPAPVSIAVAVPREALVRERAVRVRHARQLVVVRVAVGQRVGAAPEAQVALPAKFGRPRRRCIHRSRALRRVELESTIPRHSVGVVVAVGRGSDLGRLGQVGIAGHTRQSAGVVVGVRHALRRRGRCLRIARSSARSGRRMRGSPARPGCPHAGFVAVTVIAVGQRDQRQARRTIVGERAHLVVGVVGVLIVACWRL